MDRIFEYQKLKKNGFSGINAKTSHLIGSYDS